MDRLVSPSGSGDAQSRLPHRPQAPAAHCASRAGSACSSHQDCDDAFGSCESVTGIPSAVNASRLDSGDQAITLKARRAPQRGRLNRLPGLGCKRPGAFVTPPSSGARNTAHHWQFWVCTDNARSSIVRSSQLRSPRRNQVIPTVMEMGRVELPSEVPLLTFIPQYANDLELLPVATRRRCHPRQSAGLSGASRPSDASRWAARHNSRPVVAAYRRTRCGLPA